MFQLSKHRPKGGKQQSPIKLKPGGRVLTVISPVSFREGISSMFLLCSTTGLEDEKMRFISFYCLNLLFMYIVRGRELVEIEGENHNFK